jgi:hypothetical protein
MILPLRSVYSLRKLLPDNSMIPEPM